ncbi:MAG: glycoside hydrolase family 3 N-terminal domain-containing protein [Bacillota bacterium]
MKKAYMKVQKNLVALMLVIALFTSMFTGNALQAIGLVPQDATVFAAGEFIYGDISGDGLINSTDYTLLKRYVLKIISSFSYVYGKQAADVSGEGLIDSTDLTLMKRYILGIIKVFPANNITPTPTPSYVNPTPTATFNGPIYKNPAAPVEARVQDLLGRMTLDEKVGQMIQAERGGASSADVKTYYLGSVLSGGGSVPGNTIESWMQMCKNYQDAAMSTRLGIPIMYGVDAVHGHNNVYGAVIFPHNIGLGAANNPALMQEIGKVTAEEMIVTGVNWTFAPCIAVARDERWGRTYESFGEHPEIANNLLGPYIKGLQENYKIASTAKHFLADGGTSGGKDQGDAIMSEAELRRIHLPVYQKAIEADAWTVMASFSSWNGVKMHENKYLITDVLKGELGFKGFVVSDWEAIHQLSGSLYEQTVKSINAGIDMLMEPKTWRECYAHIKTAAQRGEISEQRINDAVARILWVKFKSGLFEKPLGDQSLVTSPFGSAQHREVAKKAVRESLVLLKNQNNILPLKKGAKIFVTGPAADNIGMQCGGWTVNWQGGLDGGPYSRWTKGTSILDGFKKIAQSNGGQIITDASRAREAEVAVVVLGERPYAEGQGDETDLGLYTGKAAYENKTAIDQAKATGLPVVVILVSGRPRIVTSEISGWNAFVAAWLPGTEGDGVAEVLYGDYDFTGKLPMTWPSSTAQLPINVDDMRGQTPLFPYGHGLKMY